MKDIRVALFDTKPYDREYFERINAEYGFKIKYFRNHLSRDTASLAAGFEAVCAFVNDTLDQKVIEMLVSQGVRLVAMRCAGYNNVDLKAAYRKMHVVRVPEYSPYAVAEHAVALTLSLNRKTHKAYYRTRDGNFSINGLMGFDMHGKTAGVIGTGKIGRQAAAIFKGFGMRVLAYDISPDKEWAATAGVEVADLEGLYAASDVISLHCPLTPQTRHMINEASIGKMKGGVMIINTGRGALIDSQSLVDGLKSAKIGAAGLDVYEEESEYFFEDFSSSMIGDDVLARLMTFPNVLITSHQAFFTREAFTNIARTTLQNIADYCRKGKFVNEICYRCGQSCRKKEGKDCF